MPCVRDARTLSNAPVTIRNALPPVARLWRHRAAIDIQYTQCRAHRAEENERACTDEPSGYSDLQSRAGKCSRRRCIRSRGARLLEFEVCVGARVWHLYIAPCNNALTHVVGRRGTHVKLYADHRTSDIVHMSLQNIAATWARLPPRWMAARKRGSVSGGAHDYFVMHV